MLIKTHLFLILVNIALIIVAVTSSLVMILGFGFSIDIGVIPVIIGLVVTMIIFTIELLKMDSRRRKINV